MHMIVFSMFLLHGMHRKNIILPYFIRHFDGRNDRRHELPLWRLLLIPNLRFEIWLARLKKG